MTIQAQHATRRRFTVDDYYAMADAGIFDHDERVELIEGEIVEMAPIGNRHVSCVFILDKRFNSVIGDRAIVSVQSPVRIDEHSEPEPDVMLLKWRDDYYVSTTRVPADVLLLIEVSDTTLLYDRNVKLPIYARAGIPEVWIVDLQSRRLEIFSQPSSDGYALSRVLSSGDTISPVAFSDLSFAVDDILP
ncbi:MAG: Uma2 family endonuclease [Chloroflexi bacterium]|nr:Uma2 family endonuclease [Chloroflexota bacterium]